MASDPKPRTRQSARDMLLSLAVLFVLIGAVVWLTRGCEFSPSGPSVDPASAPTVDATRELAGAAKRVDFLVRVPAVPGDWRSNSTNTIPVGTGNTASVAVRVGWVTPDGGYLRLSQSGARVPDLVVAEAGGGVTADSTGEVDVDGTRWTKHRGRGQEPSWVTTLDGVTVLITGSAGEADFRVLATAVRTARPLPSS